MLMNYFVGIACIPSAMYIYCQPQLKLQVRLRLKAEFAFFYIIPVPTHPHTHPVKVVYATDKHPAITKHNEETNWVYSNWLAASVD